MIFDERNNNVAIKTLVACIQRALIFTKHNVYVVI